MSWGKIPEKYKTGGKNPSFKIGSKSIFDQNREGVKIHLSQNNIYTIVSLINYPLISRIGNSNILMLDRKEN